MAYKIDFVACFVLVVVENTAEITRVTSFDDASGPVVSTTVGSIRGLRADDGDYSMFMGIPYAEVNRENVFGVSFFFICWWIIVIFYQKFYVYAITAQKTSTKE